MNMKARTITRNYVEIKDFENFLNQISEEALAQFAERIFFKYEQLDLISSMLKHTPSNIIREVMSMEDECYGCIGWKKIEKEWLQFLKDYDVPDNWYENCEK